MPKMPDNVITLEPEMNHPRDTTTPGFPAEMVIRCKTCLRRSDATEQHPSWQVNYTVLQSPFPLNIQYWKPVLNTFLRIEDKSWKS